MARVRNSRSRSGFLWAWLALFVVLAALAESAFAATCRVPEDQPTIQACIAAATNGDTVSVAPGLYSLPATVSIGIFKYSLIVNKNITLKSRELYQAILDGTGDDTVLILIQAAAHIEGFILQRAFKGIQQRNSPDVTWTARNLIIRDMTGQGIEINDVFTRIGTGIISNVVVDNCGSGFQTNDANGLIVRNSSVTNCQAAFVGYDHNFFTVSYTNVFNNATTVSGPVSLGPGIIEGDPRFVHVVTARQFPFFLKCNSPLIDSGDPDISFNDVQFPPSLGGPRNDIGAYGGSGAVVPLSEEERAAMLQQAECFLAVNIDIKPGSFPNSINLGSRGTVAVAILSSQTFAATTVVPATLKLAGALVAQHPNGTLMVSAEHVNNDGLLDLVVHFRTQDLNLTPSDTQATLTGQTSSGQQIQGSDSIRIVP